MRTYAITHWNEISLSYKICTALFVLLIVFIGRMSEEKLKSIIPNYYKRRDKIYFLIMFFSTIAFMLIAIICYRIGLGY